MDVFVYSAMQLKDAKHTLEDNIDKLLFGCGEVTSGG